MSKKVLHLVFLSIIITTIVILAAIFILIQNPMESKSSEYRYLLSVNVDKTTQYNITVPIPDGWIDFHSNIKFIDGYAIVTAETIDGKPAIKINANRSLKFEAFNIGALSPIDFAWAHKSNNTTKIYCEKESDAQRILLEVSYSHKWKNGSVEYSIHGELKNGEQWIKMEGSAS